MKTILLCSSNPLLIKNLYGVLRDLGLLVETCEHPAFAVQMVMLKQYDFLILDSEPFGLSAEDAVEIIKNVAPTLPVMYLGGGSTEGPLPVPRQLDLEELKQSFLSIAV